MDKKMILKNLRLKYYFIEKVKIIILSLIIKNMNVAA